MLQRLRSGARLQTSVRPTNFTRHHNRHKFRTVGADFTYGMENRLHVQQIVTGFQKQNIRTSIQQPTNDITVSSNQLVKSKIFMCNGRSNTTGNVLSFECLSEFSSPALHDIVVIFGNRLPGDTCSRKGYIVRHIFETEFFLRNRIRIERIRTNNVDSGIEIRPVSLLHPLWRGNTQHIIIAGKINGMILEYFSPIDIFIQTFSFKHNP